MAPVPARLTVWIRPPEPTVPGGCAGWRSLWFRWSRHDGAGDGGRTAVSGTGDDRCRAIARVAEFLARPISGVYASTAAGAV